MSDLAPLYFIQGWVATACTVIALLASAPEGAAVCGVMAAIFFLASGVASRR